MYSFSGFFNLDVDSGHIHKDGELCILGSDLYVLKHGYMGD